MGRTTEGRTVDVDTTDTDETITADAASFNEEDVGAAISGAGIPAGATIDSVTSDAEAELSAAATATASDVSATIAPDPLEYGFIGYSPETDEESEAYTVTAVNAGTPVPPSLLTDSTTAVGPQRARS